MTDIDLAMRERGIHPLIQNAVRRIAERRPLVVYDSKAEHYVAFMAELDTQIAFYANRTILDFALDPVDAREAGEALRVHVAKLKNVTAYVRVPAARLSDSATVDAVVDVGLAALKRNESKRGHNVGQKQSEQYTLGDTCEIHNIELSVTGVCAFCE